MNKIKAIFPVFVLMALFVLTMVGVWTAAGQMLSGDGGRTLNLFGFELPVTSFVSVYTLIVVSAVFYSLIVLVEGKLIFIAIGSLAALILSLPILFGQVSIYIIAIIPCLGLWIFSAWRMKEIIKDLLPWKPSWALHAGLPLYFTALSIIFTAAILASPSAEKFLSEPLPKEVVFFGLSYIEKPIERFANLNINHTVDQAIEISSEGKIKDPRLLAQARAELSKSLGAVLSGEETVKDVIFQIVNREINKVKDQAGDLFLIIFAVSSFFMFQLLAWPAKIIANMATRFMLFTFEAGGVIVVEDRSARKYFAHWKSSPPII
ncbi:MAG: hypothetical protein UU22_C0050G0004 [Parcubacteria group bacterium GW2011_GWA2_40_8]|nr:MAG: hypothetical protein UT82_C0002G0019 [Parcubacteria group bacterium GW2011_GWB1_40_14]KKR77177.1 MAG: hypothetical protein UU22_C0050G0004 [Parcubacteria group bacterium GW2011_GWA2_40_8]